MNSFILKSSVLFGVSYSSMQNIERMAKNLTVNNPNLRTFGTVEQILLSDYQNYGCWCFLAQTPKGKGQPVNAIDSVCKRLRPDS